MMDKTSEVSMLKWQAEVTFEGTLEQFHAFAVALAAHPVAVSISGTFGHLGPHNAGYSRGIDYETAAQEGMIEKMQKEGVPLPMPSAIPGGIRSPHLHTGQEVILVSKEQFKTFLGDVARQMTESRVEAESDFYSMIKPLTKQV